MSLTLDQMEADKKAKQLQYNRYYQEKNKEKQPPERRNTMKKIKNI